MTRFYDQNASTKVTAASTTVTFTASDLPSTSLVALHFLFAGAGMTAGDLTRVRVKSAGSTIIDCTFAMLQAYLQRFRRSNLAPAAADTTFSIPFYLPDTENEDFADTVQFPRGSAITVELVIGAGGAAGTVQAGWTLTTVEPRAYPVLLGSQLNWAASVSQARYNLQEPGIVRGIGINTAGLTRLRAVLAGRQYINLEGTSLLPESERGDNVLTIVDPIFQKLPGAEPAPQGSSFLEADTAAGWAGVANEGTIYALRPQ